MAFVDYEFYRDAYFGNAISQDQFPRLERKAEQYVDTMTYQRALHTTGELAERVKITICELSEVFQREHNVQARAFREGGAVASETVGSFSRTYTNGTIAAAESESIQQQKRDTLYIHLGSTGLLRGRTQRCMHPM